MNSALSRAGVEKDPFAKPLRIALPTSRKLDNPDRHSFAFAVRGVRKLECMTRLIKRGRHRAQRLRIEYGLASHKWKDNAHSVPVTR